MEPDADLTQRRHGLTGRVIHRLRAGDIVSSRYANRRDYLVSEAIGREILRQIGAMEPFADSDPAEVEQRLRNMSYGSTHSRISKLRRAEKADY